MRTSILLVFITILCQTACGQTRTEDQDWVTLKYIDTYKDIAMEEMIRVGIPASIKLGQGILESTSGRSDLARKARNHFGMKCGNWDGEVYYHKDDCFNKVTGKSEKCCFRKFDSAKRSYYAHSEFLQKPRYRFLFTDLNPRDYESWAHGLKTAGYATDLKYASKLIRVIRTYELYKFDKLVLEGNQDETKDPIIPVASSGVIIRNNDLRMVSASSNQTPTDISRKYRVKLKCLRKYNERLGSDTRKLAQGEKIYLQKKRRNWRGKERYHLVKEGETMYQISQIYGVRLGRLYKKNRMDEGTQPAIGEQVKIRGWKIKSRKKPQLRDAVLDETGNEVIADGNNSNEKEDEFLFEEDQVEIYHLVVKGDTLYSLALRYDITVETLKKLNDLTENTISVGQRLRVK